MIELRHQVPGRARWRVLGLRHDARLAPRVLAALKMQSGVGGVRANPACGTLVVDFDPSVVTSAAIEARLRGLLQRSLSSARSRPVGTPAPLSRTALEIPPPAGSTQRGGPGQRRGLLESLGLRPRIQPPDEPSLVCRVNLRVTRWMLRTSLRAWWHEQVPDTQSAPGDPQTAAPSLSLAWAYQLAQPLLNDPHGEPAPLTPLSARLSGWWRRALVADPRVIDA